MTTARELLQEALDLLEFWINREDRRGMSECQWKTWHALGHGSNTMKKLRAYLAQPEPEPVDSTVDVKLGADGYWYAYEPIPCPDHKPGCLVAHYKPRRMICAAQPEPAAPAPVMDTCNDVKSSSPTSGGGFSYTVGGGTLNTAPAKPEPSAEVERIMELVNKYKGSPPDKYEYDFGNIEHPEKIKARSILHSEVERLVWERERAETEEATAISLAQAMKVRAEAAEIRIQELEGTP